MAGSNIKEERNEEQCQVTTRNKVIKLVNVGFS